MLPDATIIAHRDLVITLAARYRLPAVYPWRYLVAAGALCPMELTTSTCCKRRRLMSINPSRAQSPPIYGWAPTKYETAVNLTAAKALGLTIPPTLLATADEVIE